jgi:hypothetical protein
MAVRASRPNFGPKSDFSLVEVVLARWGKPVRWCSWSLKWAASRRRLLTTSTLGCCPIGACVASSRQVSDLCRCLPARDRGGRAGSDLGLAGVERMLVIAPLPICKYKPLLGGVSAGSGMPLVDCGTVGGLGEILVLLQDDNDVCRRRHLLEDVV